MTDNHRRYIAEQAKIFKALGHPSRLLMVDTLRGGEKCVCDLQQLVGDDMSTISRHLVILREAGIVTSEKRGVNTYYKLSLDCIDAVMACISEMLEKQLGERMETLKRK